MLRQNHSGGSSTSRSFAKTALLRARRKTFQFSDEQFARYIFFTEPLFLILSVQTEVQESGPIRGAILFSKEPLFLMPPGRARSPLEAAREVGFARGPRGTLFEGTTFPRSFPLRSVARKRQQIGSPGIIARFLREPLFLLPSGRDWRSRKQRHWADRGPTQFFSREPLSLIPLGTRTPRWPQSLSSSSFSSSSMQGGSGIPAIPKTGASVLRLLPPTS
jgi:hypothetical protein